MKDFSQFIETAKKCAAPREIETGTPSAVSPTTRSWRSPTKSLKRSSREPLRDSVVMAGCDGRFKSRDYYTDVAKHLPKDTVILTAGCAGTGTTSSISAISEELRGARRRTAQRLLFPCRDRLCSRRPSASTMSTSSPSPTTSPGTSRRPLPYSALLSIGCEGHPSRAHPSGAFLSPTVADVLVKNFGITPISTVEEDVAAMMAGK